MADNDISDAVTEFIFKYVDSVELLETLLYLRANADVFYTAKAISDHLRTNPGSVSNRLTRLTKIGIVVRRDGDPPDYRYQPIDPAMTKLMDEVAEMYRIKRYHIYEMIFSPLKKINSFADAFIVRIHAKKPGDDHG